MGKRKIISEDEFSNMVLPEGSDVLGIAEKLRAQSFGEVSGRSSASLRIRGKMKRRAWIRHRDIVLASPWDFQFYAT